MPLQPNLIERLLFLSAHQAPGPLLDVLAPLGFHAVRAALSVGVFEALAQGPLSLEGLARATGAAPRGLQFLTAALEPLGYLEREGDALRNSGLTRAWLLRSSPQCLADLFHYFGDVAERWQKLDLAVRLGGPALDIAAWNEAHPGAWRRYHLGMRAIARLLAPEVVARVKLPATARRLLDVGGSHGLFAARFCQAHPELRAEVLDGPQAREVAEETFAAEGVQARVAFREGDALHSPLGEGLDAALLFAVARVLPRDVLRALFGRLRAALAPGGRLVVLDQLDDAPKTRLSRANAKLIELELFGATPGDLHSARDLSGWLVEAGFTQPARVHLRRAGGQQLLIAEVPA